MDTKKLRQKILDLAIRGKLVPQDPNDEPASVLLERIRAEKERLIKEGKIKRSKKTTSDTPHYENRQVGEANETPFEVPEGWEWTTINDICSKIGSGSTPRGSNYAKEGIPFFRSQNVYNDGLVYDDIKYISEEVHENMIGTEVRAKDLLLNITGGSLGRCAIVPDEFQKGNVSQHVCILRTIIVLPAYLHLFIISDYFAATMILSGSGREGLPKYSLETMQFPLPPHEEQFRIVTTVDKWFTLIDTLESAKEDLQMSIAQAKSKILDLAIHGKLLPQDPNDEPAIELLKRINPKFTPCDNAHDTNQLPNSWCWTTLGDVCELVTGSTPSKLHPEYYGGDFPFYKPTDLDAGRHVNIPSEFLTDEGKNVSRIIPVGSTAICCIGSIGKCGYIEKEGTTNQQINTAVPSKSLSPLYLYYFCNSSYFIDELSADSSAITISIVNKSKLSKMLISLPPYNEQLRIVAKIEELFAVLDEMQKSIEA